MHKAIETLRNSLAYAHFTDGDVHDGVMYLVDKLGHDLDEVNYEPGPDVENAVVELEQTLDQTDTATEDTDAAIADAKDEPVVDDVD